MTKSESSAKKMRWHPKSIVILQIVQPSDNCKRKLNWMNLCNTFSTLVLWLSLERGVTIFVSSFLVGGSQYHFRIFLYLFYATSVFWRLMESSLNHRSFARWQYSILSIYHVQLYFLKHNFTACDTDNLKDFTVCNKVTLMYVKNDIDLLMIKHSSNRLARTIKSGESAWCAFLDVLIASDSFLVSEDMRWNPKLFPGVSGH